MKSTIEQLRTKYNLDIVAPFFLHIEEKEYVFQCLIRGYGAEKGMIIDKDMKKIEAVDDEIMRLGFGYSCFDIEDNDIDCFQEILDDWGKSNS